MHTLNIHWGLLSAMSLLNFLLPAARGRARKRREMKGRGAAGGKARKKDCIKIAHGLSIRHTILVVGQLWDVTLILALYHFPKCCLFNSSASAWINTSVLWMTLILCSANIFNDKYMYLTVLRHCFDLIVLVFYLHCQHFANIQLTKAVFI